MKRAISFMLSTIMVLSLALMNVFAVGTITISVGAGDQTVSAGETVSLPVIVEQNTGISSAKMKVNFNTDVFELVSFSAGDITGDTVTTDASKSMIAWMKAETEDSTKTGVLCYINLKVRESNTITGEQTIGVSYYKDEDDFLDAKSDNVTVTFSSGIVTVNSAATEDPDAPEVIAPYTVELNTNTAAVKVGDEITVDVLVGGTTKEFASSELELTYTGLTFDANNSTANGADITAENGTIKIIDHGETTTWTEGTVTAYTLAFTVDSLNGATSGSASVTLNSAALSTAANAKENNLTPATITVAEKTFAVTPADLTVTLPAGITGNTTVEYDGTITIEATDKNYEYELLVSGNYTIIDNEDGTWTIKNVTEDIEISIDKKQGKEHTITFSNPTHIKDQENATIAVRYGNDFSFTLKDTESPTVGQDGIQYILDSIKYTGSDVDVTRTKNGTTYTIPGSAITGDITITTSAAPLSAEEFTVEVTEDSTDLSAPTTANKGQTITLTLTPEVGYKYTVTYTMGNNAAVTIENWVDQDGGKVTAEIANVNGNIKITVDKEVDKGEINVDVKEYLDLDDKTMYLITAAGALADDKVYTYDGNAMFYSEEYRAYVWLVITGADETLTADTALTKISIAQESATEIDYTGDVNMTEKVDANDAQLVWNIYNDKLYSDFRVLSMEKFLRADVEGDGDIDTDDAALIIAAIKNRQE